MALETGTYISDLVVTNPTSSDPKSQGDDHLRLIKSTVLATFPNINGAMTSTEEELNILDGATLSTAELNLLDGVTASTAELNILDGATLTVTELNYVDGVTSSIQDQIDLKAPLASPALTGAPTAPTAAPGSSGSQIATLDYANALAFSSALPAQTGNANKLLKTDGSTASWTDTLNPVIVTMKDGSDATKKVDFNLASLTTSTTRTVTFVDQSMTLFTPGYRLLLTVVASNSATVDLEDVFDSTYDNYVIQVDNLTCASTADLRLRFKIAGSYKTTNYARSNFGGAIVASHSICDNLGNGAAVRAGCTIWIQNPESTTQYHSVRIIGSGYGGLTTGGSVFGTFESHLGSSDLGALTGLRFIMSSGNILTGNFRVYGARGS